MPATRRDVLRSGLAAAGLGVHGGSHRSAPPTARAGRCPTRRPRHLPRWRGFNLLDKFMADSQKPFEERDFADIAELGFDFVRLPMDYRCWTDQSNPSALKEPVLKEIDQAVEFGKKHGVHVQINFHRAPGYTVAKPAGAEIALDRPRDPGVCASHWAAFADAVSGTCRTTRSASTCSTSPTTRSSRTITAAWSSAGGRDPRPRPEAADRLRRPRLGRPSPRPS